MHLQWDSDDAWIEVMDGKEVRAIYFMRLNEDKEDTYGDRVYAALGTKELFICKVPKDDAEDLLVEAYRVHE